MPDLHLGPQVVPVDQAIAEMAWWFERPWPIPEPKVANALTELGWQREAEDSNLVTTGHQVNDPEALLQFQQGYLYRCHYKVSDLVREPREVDEAGFRSQFSSIVATMAERFGPGSLRPGAEPRVSWTHRMGALVEVAWGVNSVAVSVLSPAAEFDRRVADAEQS